MAATGITFIILQFLETNFTSIDLEDKAFHTEWIGVAKNYSMGNNTPYIEDAKYNSSNLNTRYHTVFFRRSSLLRNLSLAFYLKSQCILRLLLLSGQICRLLSFSGQTLKKIMTLSFRTKIEMLLGTILWLPTEKRFRVIFGNDLWCNYQPYRPDSPST